MTGTTALTSWTLTFTFAARDTFSRISGKLRQPSSSTCLPSRSIISGLISTIFSSGFFLKLTSITVIRCEMLICGAASPIPCAAYIDSNISSVSFFSFASNTVTFSPGFDNTGSGHFTTS